MLIGYVGEMPDSANDISHAVGLLALDLFPCLYFVIVMFTAVHRSIASIDTVFIVTNGINCLFMALNQGHITWQQK